MLGAYKEKVFAKVVRAAPSVEEADRALEKLFGATTIPEKTRILTEKFGIVFGGSIGEEWQSEEDVRKDAYYAALETLIL